MMHAIISVAERRLGVRLEYLRYMAKISNRLVWRFSKMATVANCRRAAPPDAFHVACLAATLAEDCGECVQIAINSAKRDGVSRETLRSVVFGRPDQLPDGLKVVHSFAQESMSPRGPSEALRNAIKDQYGEVALIEIVLGIVGARAFPQVKRGLGFATTCSLAPPTI